MASILVSLLISVTKYDKQFRSTDLFWLRFSGFSPVTWQHVSGPKARENIKVVGPCGGGGLSRKKEYTKAAIGRGQSER